MTVGFAIARALTRPTHDRQFPLTVWASTARSVTVDATEQTRTPGVWGMFLSTGGHVRVEGTPSVAGDTVMWRLSEGQEPPAVGERASWTGIVARNPSSAGLNATDHLVRTAAGIAPTWFVDSKPGETHPVWAVHIHGLHSSRAGTLRGVAAASAAGIPSVIPAYRNTAEGPRFGSGRTNLGWAEADDIVRVLEELSVTGRERFVLFGWSLGAQTALRLAESPRWRGRVVGLVLDSAVLNWPNVIAANLSHSRLPARAGKLAYSWLTTAWKARLVGLSVPVPLDRMDWVARAGGVSQPVLVHHGTGDWSAPIEDARAFAAVAPDAVLVESDAGHTVSWNVDPERWHDWTVQFVRRVVSQTSA